MGSSGIGFQVTAEGSGGKDDACFSDMSIVDAVPRLQKDLCVTCVWRFYVTCDTLHMYDVKKQLASMTLTLRNVAVLDTKARFHPSTHSRSSLHLFYFIHSFSCASVSRLLIL